MVLDGDPIVLKNNREVSLYNTKPPFVIWLQALSIKLLGPTELAIRLPSALAALLTVLMLVLFSKRTLGDIRIGVVAALVLVTTQGYARNHIARSGDLDAVLIFWIVFYSLLAFHYLLRAPQNYRWYFSWIGIGMAAAFLSKSIAGWMPLLGLLGAAIVSRRLGDTLKKPYLYLVGVLVLATGAVYYGWRESLAPGYLDKVFFSEYQRLTDNIMPWHERPFWFYAQNMWQRDFFTPHVYLLVPAFVLGLWRKDQWRRFTWMLLVFCGAYFLLISYPPVKLEWYAAPLYPFLALLIGVGWCRLMDIGESYVERKEAWSGVFFYALLAAFMAYPYFTIWNSIQNRKPVDSFEREGYTMRQWQAEKPDLKSYQVLMTAKYPQHLDQFHFYRKALNHWEEGNIRHAPRYTHLAIGDTVLCCQSENLDTLQQQFEIEELRVLGDCKLWKLR